MKILHLYSNYKYTGPADPALLLAKAQQDQGHEVTFCCGHPPSDQPTHLQTIAIDRGLSLYDELKLPKHFQISSLRKDVSLLRDWIKEESPDVIHCHLSGDHLIASLASRKLPPLILKSQYQLKPEKTLRNRYCRQQTDLWIAPTRASAIGLEEWGVSPTQILQAAPPVDLSRFKPRDCPSVEVDQESRIRIGVVARMQRHRKFPQLIEAFSLAAAEDPKLVLEILGRGTHQEEVAKEPARRSGFEDRIKFPGYVEQALYPQSLQNFDMLIFLVPGSDGTCRAAREALSSGIPVIASRRGLLPELIPEDCGILLRDETSAEIASAIIQLAQDSHGRKVMGENARNHSLKNCSPSALAQSLDNAIQPLLSSI